MFYKYLNKKLSFIPPSSDTQLFKINWSPLGASKDGEYRVSSDEFQAQPCIQHAHRSAEVGVTLGLTMN